jgi:U3 small nucleolar RNA-associated protein 3
LEPNELDDLLQDAETRALPQPKQKPPKKKRKIIIEDTKQSRTNPIFDLVEPHFVSSKSASSHRRNNDVSEDPLDNYCDATSLAAVDAADKSARRKNLRFHTSKIESASSRRKSARSQMAGGDDDIPYRERKKDRDARLVREAVRRAENDKGGDLTLGGDEDEEEKCSVGEKRTRPDEEDDSPDEYYKLVQKKSKEVKARKQAEYDEAHSLPR